MNANDSFDVIPSGAALGADIVGLDLTQEINSAVFDRMIDAWDKHLVLRFRNQNLTEDQFVRFSRYLATSTRRRHGLLTEATIQHARKLPWFRISSKAAFRLAGLAIQNWFGIRT